jgi:hypothetical protein
MRSINLPPVLRANSQLNNAVLAPPICKYPVGDGANRVTILSDISYEPFKRYAKLSDKTGIVKNNSGTRMRTA